MLGNTTIEMPRGILFTGNHRSLQTMPAPYPGDSMGIGYW